MKCFHTLHEWDRPNKPCWFGETQRENIEWNEPFFGYSFVRLLKAGVLVNFDRVKNILVIFLSPQPNVTG